MAMAVAALILLGTGAGEEWSSDDVLEAGR